MENVEKNLTGQQNKEEKTPILRRVVEISEVKNGYWVLVAETETDSNQRSMERFCFDNSGLDKPEFNLTAKQKLRNLLEQLEMI